MSSVGQVVGGAVGLFFGGPMGAQIGIMLGGLLDPPKLPTINGPRVSDLSVQTATYAATIPRVYGTVAVKGNVFWVEGDRLKESVKKTKSGGKGGPSQTTKTYSYSATFAVGLCKGPIAGVRRIWVGANLIYDAGSSDLEAIIASNQAASGFKVYLGDETQLPNPRMQADKGVSNTPGYRGLAYIVFYDLGLEPYGNSLMGAQVKVEVVKVASPPSWQRIITVNDVGVSFPTFPYIYEVDDGVVKVNRQAGEDTYVFSSDGTFINSAVGTIEVLFSSEPSIACGRMGGRHLAARSATGFGPEDGPVLYYCGATTNIVEQRIDSNLPYNRPIVACAIANDGESAFVVSGDPELPTFGENSGCVWSLISKSGLLLRQGIVGFNFSNSQMGFSRIRTTSYASCAYDQDTCLLVSAFGASGGSVMRYLIDENDVLQRYDGLGLSYFTFTSPGIYTKDNIIYVFSGPAYNVFAEVGFQGNQIPLSSIIQSETLQSQLITPSDINTSTLTDQVRGYRISQQGAIRGAIEPLQTAYPFDVVQRGYQLHYVRRPKAPVAVVDEIIGEFRVDREMDAELPREVTVEYLDVDREYE